MAGFASAFRIRSPCADDGHARCGERLDLSELDRVAVDCCSTGGVGDKVPLIAAPIAAAAGVAVPDDRRAQRRPRHRHPREAAIDSGFRTDLNVPEFSEVVSRHGLAFAGQSNALAPADKKLYELRDETATVESLPLIAASAMSKKLAEDLKGWSLMSRSARDRRSPPGRTRVG